MLTLYFKIFSQFWLVCIVCFSNWESCGVRLVLRLVKSWVDIRLLYGPLCVATCDVRSILPLELYPLSVKNTVAILWMVLLRHVRLDLFGEGSTFVNTGILTSLVV